MSASEGNQADSRSSDAHDQGDEHDHGPPPPPEPKTPMWLPAVGAVLFLTVGLLWALSTPPDEKTDLSGIPAGSATATATAPAGTGAAPTRGDPHGAH